MKILTAEQIRQVEEYTMEHEPIQPIDLMERASNQFTQWFVNKFKNKGSKIAVFCGTGNNGGDGLAVARMLTEKGYDLDVFVLNKESKSSYDFDINYERVSDFLVIKSINESSELPLLNHYNIIVDAIFGTGLSRPVTDIYKEVIEKINNSSSTIVSVDIASGISTDASFQIGAAIKPDFTVSFQLPKLPFVLPEYSDYVGDWYLVDIGLNNKLIEKLDSPYRLINDSFIKTKLIKREKFSHKGTYGHGLLIGGSFGKIGAIVLAAKAFLRTGGGLLSVKLPSCGYSIIQSLVPEAMAICEGNDSFIDGSVETDKYITVGIGPGLGNAQPTVKSLQYLLKKYTKPIVLDADALNIISEHSNLLQEIPEGSIITPHPTEFRRFVGDFNSDMHRLKLQQSFSKKNNLVIVFKGAHSTITNTDGIVYFNSTGNPGMATAGSGDVLTGIITGLLSQRYSAINAAIIGVYLHGFAGDLAAKELGQESMIASDIVEYLPKAFMSLS